MKKLAIIPWNDNSLKDALFNACEWTEFKEYLTKVGGWEVHTIDCYSVLESVDLFVFFWFDKKWYKQVYRKQLLNRTLYVAFEPPVVDWNHSEKGMRFLLQFFRCILTWNDDLVDNKRFFKFMFPHFLRQSTSEYSFGERKLLVNISANKVSGRKNELYSERKRVIEYFDKEDEQFELYGVGWEGYLSWKGTIEKKVTCIINSNLHCVLKICII